MFDFNKLRNFIVVAEAKSITEAAVRLRRTQSAISQQLQALEDELGLCLLERRSGQMHLTREGSQLIAHTKPLFEQMEGGIREIQGRMDLVKGIIKVGATPTIFDYLLLSHLAEFRRQHPGISAELVLQPDETLENHLRDDVIDFAFIVEFKERDFFEVQPCFTFDEVLVGSPAYIKEWDKQCGPGTRQFEDLKEAQLVDFGDDVPNIRHWLKKNTTKYRQILEDKRPAMIIEDYESVKRLVLAGLGLAMLPRYMMDDDSKDSRLVEVFPKCKPTKVSVDFAMRKKKNLHLTMKLFLDYMQTVVLV